MAICSEIQRIGDGIFAFHDTCNVYLIKDGEHALAIDYGSGVWREALPALGVRSLDHVLLTHHHPDQCAGLLDSRDASFVIHAPDGEQPFLSADGVERFHTAARFGSGCPASYAVLPRGIADIRYDISGFTDFTWRGRRIRFISTPGHGQAACSILVNDGERQLLFCGDAAHAGGAIWQPFHLEWDHWTGRGALAAWEGIQRLLGIHIDLLCPAHGPIICEYPRRTLLTLARRVLAFYLAKGAIAADEPDRYIAPLTQPAGAFQYLPHLYQFGENGYLLASKSGEALIVDPCLADLPALEELLAALPGIHPSALIVSHYHFDHCDAIPLLQARYGACAYLHPLVAAPPADPASHFLPWLPHEPIRADVLWPDEGEWQWNEYTFQVAHWPGQTWWHSACLTTVDGQRVLFAGDSFQPASRWNGTGGFCAYNFSRFDRGFLPSAEKALGWRPDIVASGHNCCYRFAPRQFRKIMRWAKHTAQIVRELCPSGDLDIDYYIAAQAVEQTISAQYTR